jgi:hypothetical protein
MKKLEEASKQKIKSWSIGDDQEEGPNLKLISRYSRPVRKVLKMMKKLKRANDDEDAVKKF